MNLHHQQQQQHEQLSLSILSATSAPSCCLRHSVTQLLAASFAPTTLDDLLCLPPACSKFPAELTTHLQRHTEHTQSGGARLLTAHDQLEGVTMPKAKFCATSTQNCGCA